MSCVAKSVYKISDIEREQDDFTHTNPLAFNHKCYQILKKQKDLITQYNQTKRWDKYKKYMNEFELVFTSSNGFPNISKYAPISRSFFKLWEILHDFKDELPTALIDPSCQLKACSIAEGPGGFIEALVKYRNDVTKAKPSMNQLFGMTLISQNKNVPNWKLTREFVRTNNVTLCYGKDGTGSLYKMANIIHLCELTGYNTCDIVTGDGGFDYSNDFNEQEEASLPLLLCEALAACMLQKTGGSFILKMFDISNTKTFQLLFCLYQMYENVYFTKPFSSRPANSEKYVVCTGFKGPDARLQKALQDAINDPARPLIQVPVSFTKEVVYFNTYYTTHQTANITRTLDFIDSCEGNGNMNDALTLPKIKQQVENAIRWCHKYNLQISILSLIHYRKWV